MLRLWIILFCLFPGIKEVLGIEIKGNADSFLIHVWNVDNSLPTNALTSLIQTPDGYIWVGTQTGLVRFDGVAFQVYNTENTKEITNQYIKCLAGDDKGAIWLGTDHGGLIRYCGNKFELFSVDTGLVDNGIRSIVCSKQGMVWIGTRKGLNLFYEETGKIITIPFPESVVKRYVRQIYEDRNGNIWVGTTGGDLVRIFREGKEFKSELFRSFPSSVETILLSRNGTLWIGTRENGLIGIQGTTEKQWDQSKGLSYNYIYCLYEDENSNLWVGTYGGGVNILHNNEILVINTENNLSSNVVTSILEDREGSIWIATNGGGLNQVRASRVYAYTEKDGISPDLYGILQDSRGVIWIGSIGFGVNRFENGKFERLTTENGLSHNNVLSIAEDNEGSIFFSTFGGGVCRLKNGKISVCEFKGGTTNKLFRTVYADRHKRILAGNEAGTIYRFSDGVFTLFKQLRSPIVTMLEDSRGGLWIGTWEKGIAYFPPSGKPTYFSTANGLSSNSIFALYEDQKGVIWIGTSNNGLNRYWEGKFQTIKKENGLPDNVICSIQQDNLNKTWISSNRGIYSLDYNQLDDFFSGKTTSVYPVLFGKEEGMKSIECSSGVQKSVCKTRDGKLMYPIINGLMEINPSQLRLNGVMPQVVIQSVLVNEKNYLSPISKIEQPGTCNLEIHYTALSFQVPHKVLFKYKLENFDTKWIDAGTRRTAFYTNIPPGQFTFSVIACNNDGLWNKKGASFDLNIKPQFYQTWPFYFIMGLLVILFILGSMQLRIRQIKHREKKLVDLVSQRTQELIESNSQLLKANESKSELLNIVAHDLRNRLQIILGFADLIENDPSCPQTILPRVGHILKSSNQMSEMINDILDTAVMDNMGRLKLKRESLNLSELAAVVLSSFRPIAEKKEQTFDIFIEENIMITGDKGRLKEVMDNLLSNAIKYSPLKKPIGFMLRRLDQTVRIEVMDQGPGISEADMKNIFKKFQRLSARPTGGESSTGLGLSITRQMVEMHNGTIRVESLPGNGSIFIVELPIN